jgi:hypothetical protein
VANLTARDRERLARAWLGDALLEHASIASFVRLACELAALGAPAGLCRRALDAAAEEERHARLCFALASGYAGVELAPSRLPPIAPRVASLRIIANESLVDGCVGEYAAARGADEARSSARDGAVGAVLDVIARDEARHAQLARDVVAFAAAQGVIAVADARVVRATTEGDGAAMRAHGRVDGARFNQFAAHARELAHRSF